MKRAFAEDDAKGILNRIRRLVRILRAFEREAQGRFNLGAAQLFILHVLQAERPLSLKEVADRTATDQSSVSVAVARLVEEGYVEREVSRTDRRQVALSLTARGRALIRRAPPAAQERILAGVETMPARDRVELMRLLDEVIGRMDSRSDDAPMLFQDGHSARRKRHSRPRLRR